MLRFVCPPLFLYILPLKRNKKILAFSGKNQVFEDNWIVPLPKEFYELVKIFFV